MGKVGFHKVVAKVYVHEYDIAVGQFFHEIVFTKVILEQYHVGITAFSWASEFGGRNERLCRDGAYLVNLKIEAVPTGVAGFVPVIIARTVIYASPDQFLVADKLHRAVFLNHGRLSELLLNDKVDENLLTRRRDFQDFVVKYVEVLAVIGKRHFLSRSKYQAGRLVGKPESDSIPLPGNHVHDSFLGDDIAVDDNADKVA